MGISFTFIILIGYFLAIQIAKSKDLDYIKVSYSLIIIIFFAIIGSRLYYIIFHEQILFWNGGTGSSGVWLGGFIGVAVVTFIFNINIWKLLDSIAIPITLSIIIGRTSCFFNGCCYGVYPVQLYEAGFSVILLLMSIYLLKYSEFDGQSFLLIMIFYPLSRILFEFLRVDNTVFILGFSLPQWIYLTIFIAGAIIIKKRNIVS